jgi:hypothetical protein
MGWTATRFSPKKGTSTQRALVDSAEQAELFLCPGREHLFADSSLSCYGQAAASLLTRRVLDFLAEID